MMKKNSVTKLVAMFLMLAVAAGCMTGCGSRYDASNYTPPAIHYEGSDDPDPAVTDQKQEPEQPVIELPGTEDPVPETQQPDVSDGENGKPEIKMESVEAISEIAGLVGNYSQYCMQDYAVVDIDSNHNPYDLTWTYGEKPSKDLDLMSSEKRDVMADPEWHALYDSYVAACDWSLVFDAGYYMSQFPMLAYLYQRDEALLLEHFQTVGIHEGRQGSKSFNVYAYMQNCSPELRAAFGEHYECYYFYWMLNQETEQSVTITGSGNPAWLAVQLTYYQKEEYEHVNKYREEVGADPVILDPEMIAFANYRAWHDAKYAIKAHDALDDPEINDCMDMLDLDHFAENTCKWQYPSSTGQSTVKAPYANYRGSEGHYKAMTAKKYVYTGSSNAYVSEYTKRTVTHFDMFTEYTPVTSR